MNHIKIEKKVNQYGYEEVYWSIDGMIITEYLNQSLTRAKEPTLDEIGSFDGLCPAWSKELDFSCLVIVVEVNKTKDFVYWNRIGYVLHEHEDFEQEKRSGILHTDSYSDEDWETYGDHIALENVNSHAWQEWISTNWEEELYRRRMNYTLPYFQAEGNICWFCTVDWCFDRCQYEKMVEEFWQIATKKQLQHLQETLISRSLDVASCGQLLADLTLDARLKLYEHTKDYEEVLLHLLAEELLGEPLFDLLKATKEKKNAIEIYIMALEIMWKAGNSEVQNVVDVTILERLSDEEDVWQAFEKYISDDFKRYINEEVLSCNFMMACVKKLD